MKIAILGTRGIPNTYGGFEQFAEYVSAGLVKRGHDVTVYNPHFHEFNKTFYKGVRIRKKYSPEEKLGAAANFIYDFLCLRDALQRDFDIILECGYGTSAVSYYLCPINRSIIVTNMDGLEWKRAKWSRPVKKLMKLFEKWGAERSHALVADNEGIRSYLLSAYGKDSTVIQYGAFEFKKPAPAVLSDYEVQENNFYLLIARLEPENNIEIILEGYMNSDSENPFLVVGNHETKYGDYLKRKFNQNNIRFLGSIYDDRVINNLRYFSKGYFHGHSVGGTNPSLLEAMGCHSFIFAHKNEFNEMVLKNNAFYFSSSEEVKQLIVNFTDLSEKRNVFIKNNLDRINTVYSWESIITRYEKLFNDLIENQ